MSSSNTVINPKPCSYNCGVRIHWNTLENAYFEVFTKQKHICKNRPINKPSVGLPTGSNTNTNRPYYSKKPYIQRQKMSNSLELLSGPISEVQKKYELLSDIVTDLGGKCHGSQSHINGNNISLVVYYEVPIGQRDLVKQKFNNITRNNLILQR